MNGISRFLEAVLFHRANRCELSTKTRSNSRSDRSLLGTAVLAAAIALAISAWQGARWESSVQAEPRRITPQQPDQHFKSGGRLSETVLQEILVVLKKMDERLERLEQHAEQLVDQTGRPVVSSTGSHSGSAAPSSSPLHVRRSR